MTRYLLMIGDNENIKDTFIKVNIRKAGVVKGFPFDSKDKNYHQRYRVTLERNLTSKAFYFYDSAYNYNNGISLKPENIPDVVMCIFEDGLFGYLSYESFCRVLGYNPEKINTIKIYKACQRTASKLSELGLDEENLNAAIHYLRRKYDI